MSEGGEPDGCSPYCPAVRPARPGPLLIYPGDLIGYGKLRELALPPHAHDPSVKFHDLYDKLATIKCAGLVLNDTLPGEPDFDRWGLPTEGTLRPLFGLWTCENAFNSDLHDRVAGAVTHLLNTTRARLPFNTGLEPLPPHHVRKATFALRSRVEQLLHHTSDWIRRFDPLASWRMWMRARMFNAPTDFQVRGGGCTTTLLVSEGSSDWARDADQLAQDYTLLFCINSKYKFHYRLPDKSEYCVLIEPGTVIGFLGGVFEYKLEEDAPHGGAPGCFITCYTSKTMFGEGGPFPMPHQEMHIHPKQEVRVAPREPQEPPPSDLVTPRSSKRLKVAHQRRDTDEDDQPEVRHIDGHGKRFSRPATTMYYPNPPSTTNANTAVHRCLHDLDPLCWPKFTVVHVTTAYGHKTSEPLKRAANKLQKVTPSTAFVTYPATWEPGRPDVESALGTLRGSLNSLLKHTVFALDQMDRPTVHRMRHRHTHFCGAEPWYDAQYGAATTTFSIAQGGLDWTRGVDHASEDYTLLFSPSADCRLHLRTPDGSETDVLELRWGTVAAFLGELYEYRVEAEPDALVFTCWTSKAVGAPLPDVNDVVSLDRMRGAFRSTKALWKRVRDL